MRRIVFTLILIGANLSFIACTDDSLAEVEEQNPPIYADGDTGGGTGGDDPMDPPPDPPGSGGN
jgi:hypothetical protein